MLGMSLFKPERYVDSLISDGQLTGEQIPGLSLRTWIDFLHENELPVKRG